MININVNNPSMLRNAGMQVLAESLGPVDFTRFIQQFETGYGDYTQEKYQQPTLSFDELESELQHYL